jgi:putative FmdB family regulatory protein
MSPPPQVSVFLMPTYEYVCEKCGRTFDYFQSMKDPRLTECIFEDCDGAVRRKLGTGAGIIFKGSGFYETDYRSAEYKSAAKKESESSSPKGGEGSKPDGKGGGKGGTASSGGAAGGGGSGADAPKKSTS